MTGTLGGAVGASTYTQKSLRRNLSDIKGSRKDIKSMRRMRTKAGLKADMYLTSNQGQLPNAAYAPPHKHVENFVSRDEYKKMLQDRTKQRISNRTLDRGAVFIPQYEK